MGEWFTNNTLAEFSGYQAAGHARRLRAVGTGGYSFVADMPPGRSGLFAFLERHHGASPSRNSSTLDATYTNTFDDTTPSAFTVAFWAKGFPSAWNYLVSKNGDSGSPESGWTIAHSRDATVTIIRVGPFEARWHARSWGRFLREYG